MLEKMAEMVREQGGVAAISCAVCSYQPRNSDACTQYACPQNHNPDSSLMLARWAVLLAARALEKEVAEAERLANQKQMRSGAYIRLASGLMNLITEAKEAAHEA